jgi:hypothetical protein
MHTVQQPSPHRTVQTIVGPLEESLSIQSKTNRCHSRYELQYTRDNPDLPANTGIYDARGNPLPACSRSETRQLPASSPSLHRARGKHTDIRGRQEAARAEADAATKRAADNSRAASASPRGKIHAELSVRTLNAGAEENVYDYVDARPSELQDDAEDAAGEDWDKVITALRRQASAQLLQEAREPQGSALDAESGGGQGSSGAARACDGGRGAEMMLTYIQDRWCDADDALHALGPGIGVSSAGAGHVYEARKPGHGAAVRGKQQMQGGNLAARRLSLQDAGSADKDLARARTGSVAGMRSDDAHRSASASRLSLQRVPAASSKANIPSQSQHAQLNSAGTQNRLPSPRSSADSNTKAETGARTRPIPSFSADQTTPRGASVTMGDMRVVKSPLLPSPPSKSPSLVVAAQKIEELGAWDHT